MFCLCAPVFAAEPSNAARDFPAFGLTIELPANAAVSPVLPSNKVFESRHAGSSDGAFALIFPTSGVAHVSVQDMVKVGNSGEVNGTFTIDGEPARMMRTPAIEKNPPGAMLVASHGNRTLVIEGYGEDDAHAQQNALAVAASVRFKEPEPLYAHADISDKSRFRYKAGQGFVSVAGPEWLRMLRQEAKVCVFGGQDFTTGKVPFVVAVSEVDASPGELDAGVVQNWAGALQAKYKVAEGVEFRNTADNPHVFTTQPVHQATPGDDGLMAQRFALVQVSPGAFVSLIFNVYDDNESRARAYLNLAGKMVDSVHIIPPANTADAAGK